MSTINTLNTLFTDQNNSQSVELGFRANEEPINELSIHN